MNALLPWMPFRSRKSYSLFVDVQQWTLRNLLLFGTSLSMLRILFGELILCQNTDGGSLTQAYLDTRCFVHGTTTRGDQALHHDYYPWVSIYLLLLALGFYAPFALWRRWVGNDLGHLENGEEEPETIVERIRDCRGHGLFTKTVVLEGVYPCQVALLLWATDVFFHHKWSASAWSWQTIEVLFPDTADCFFEYHHGGGSTTGKFSCLLPLCSVYRKVFYALYGVMVALMGMYGWMLIYRGGLCIWKKDRNVWWALTIVQENTQSWKVRKRIHDEWNGPRRKETWV